MINLEELSINHFTFIHVPNNICALTKLKSLTLTHGTKLIKFPHAICYVKCLKRLTLTRCSIRIIPDQIYKLQHLEYLCINHTNLQTLPNSIIKMLKLRTIVLSDNKFTEFPDILHQIVLTSDTKIDMSCNRIEDVPTIYKFSIQEIIEKILLTDPYKNEITTWITVYVNNNTSVVNYLINPHVFDKFISYVSVYKKIEVLLCNFATAMWITKI